MINQPGAATPRRIGYGWSAVVALASAGLLLSHLETAAAPIRFQCGGCSARAAFGLVGEWSSSNGYGGGGLVVPAGAEGEFALVETWSSCTASGRDSRPATWDGTTLVVRGHDRGDRAFEPMQIGGEWVLVERRERPQVAAALKRPGELKAFRRDDFSSELQALVYRKVARTKPRSRDASPSWAAGLLPEERR